MANSFFFSMAVGTRVRALIYSSSRISAGDLLAFSIPEITVLFPTFSSIVLPLIRCKAWERVGSILVSAALTVSREARPKVFKK